MEARAVAQYSPSSCKAPVTLVRSPDMYDSEIELTWQEVSRGGLAIRRVDVPHGSLLDVPHVARIAQETLTACPKVV